MDEIYLKQIALNTEAIKNKSELKDNNKSALIQNNFLSKYNPMNIMNNFGVEVL